MSDHALKDASIWEKLVEALSGFGDGVSRIISRLFGSSNDRLVRSFGYVRNRPTDQHQVVPGSLLDQVNRLEESMKALSDEELKGLTPGFKERLAAGEKLDALLPEAFAACREAGRRTKNMRHFDVQILGGICLHQGMIAEMVTGEGKTLVATLPAYLNALEGKGVHIITVNDYLARRDCEWMSPIYHALGISCGYIQSDMENEARRKAYDCDITYGTNSEFGFDYLRDNMKPARWADPDYPPHLHQVQRALHYAIIDEVDNILIDEARTPLIISGPAFGDLRRYAKANEVAVKLIELEKRAQNKLKELGHGLNIPHHPLAERDGEGGEPEETSKKKKKGEENGQEEDLDVSHVITQELEQKKEKRLGYYFEVKEKERTCHLTDEGIRKAEELAGVESFYSGGNMEWPHLIDNALKAHMLYRKEKEYVVMRHPETNEMSVIIVDEFTGRLMIGRQWSDGLHQAVEAKHAREGVKIKEETQTLATVTLQNYFKLYKKLSGMTGTAMTEASEFWKIYQLDVVAMPTNQPLSRINYPDLIYLTEKEKWNAVIEDVERIHRWDILHLTDRTELIGTIKKENDSQIEIELRDGKEKRAVPRDQVNSIDRRGRPILLGTTDVDKSEKLSSLLKRRGIKHELLNAKPEYAAREAEIVAQAGRLGAVTISTNMAGRGTDIILGGNPETLAWSRLKDQYPTRLDVPDDIWKTTVDDIRAREGMAEQGRQVAEMGGLHIIGTERHEARRIDNQLRGRAGRQGDPGSSRFFLSLQDDLMRIFAGEWVAGLLQRMGMEEGQAIESRMVSRRIEAAQKKVEERNFDIRKNLLEYDEVMDYQRKRVYGFRQEILDGANCKIRILRMIEEQLDQALERYLDDDFGPASFAEMASQRLGVELNPGEFHNTNFEDAQRNAKERASNSLLATITELMDENLDPDADPKEWAWQTLSARVNNLWELKTTDRQLKQIGRDGLAEFLVQQADDYIAGVDLAKGALYLERDWGVRSLCDWLQRKFLVEVDPADLKDLDPSQVREKVLQAIHALYRQKEAEFPVTVAMARFMSDRTAGHSPMGQRYDREGLLQWYRRRFADSPDGIGEEEFRTQSRARLQEMLVEVARKSFPEAGFTDIDSRLEDSFEGARIAEEEDAREIADWAREAMNLQLQASDLTGKTIEEARDHLYTAYELRYCPEMKRMERSLLLNQVDAAWKNHLYVMDHLRQGIGLVGYAQIDPKTEYKRQGMKEFDSMWGNLADKISDAVFRLEDDEAFQESVWAIGSAVHEQAQSALSAAGGIQAQQQAAIAGSQQSDKKPEPIRNRAAKVGRNDPCPCGSGKKYKNCCMRAAAR